MKTLDDIVFTQLRTIQDNRGTLVPIESKMDCLLTIERVFTIYDCKAGEVRGQHAHKTTKQFFVCLKGQCTVTCDDGSSKKKYVLNRYDKGLFIPEMIWAEQTYDVNDSILQVMCDTSYDESDYIRKYDEFLSLRT
jgi:dTDP-4-dehydrorhamnose 3,5-epimerase-like enzyme